MKRVMGVYLLLTKDLKYEREISCIHTALRDLVLDDEWSVEQHTARVPSARDLTRLNICWSVNSAKVVRSVNCT